MTTTLPTAKLGFEFNPAADINASCARCLGGLGELAGEWARFVAVVLNGKRICETCSDELKPGIWEIAAGMEEIFTGLIHLTEGERWAASLRISMFVSKLADAVGTNQPWTDEITTTN